MTREEHLAWCKKRAHEYLDQGDLQNAVASMMSDMQKHPETAFDNGDAMSQLGLFSAMSGDRQAVKRYIDGFN